jgi:hypothetical protein
VFHRASEQHQKAENGDRPPDDSGFATVACLLCWQSFEDVILYGKHEADQGHLRWVSE